MIISIIAAIQRRDRGLGYGGKLLCRLPSDMERFARLTTRLTDSFGVPTDRDEGFEPAVVMGRRTHEEIGRPLPRRFNVVLSASGRLAPSADLAVVPSWADALRVAQLRGCSRLWVIGGTSLYGAAMAFADELHLTTVEGDLPADIFFPAWQRHFAGQPTIVESGVDPETGLRWIYGKYSRTER
ncbi:hypothetical protein A3C96_03550 [Candidatus Uhrbacteria bacterium RIFCSPHIGHO2_02_FULL_60_10]|uniref:dihydrofolate reductase n=1 Tax=Candidatus Uhrbacteria bacterium RIFCSPHIGHO2_02_FULL_60_10 TaxID=1802392 RepID=A0A1F7U3L6_9BACT|nr:MAG: hypothetical protein A3C96_03550 [Candidatus Uhrbacteria bacterium RIFCSPHIGHO2_02_FULL_60_10]